MDVITRDTLKRWSTAIVAQVEPDDVFVVEDVFKASLKDWREAVAQDEGRFWGGAELSTFAAVVGPFLLAFFGDVIKDVVKDGAKKAVGALLDRVLKREAKADEAARLRGEINAAIDKSRFTAEQKKTLRDGFQTFFNKVGGELPKA
jgi:hypothetical protein